jgi:hypothetical protein
MWEFVDGATEARILTSRGALAVVSLALAGLLAGCQIRTPEPAASPSAIPAAISEPLPAIDWAGAPDCQAKLALVVEATKAGRWPPDERPPIAVVLGRPSDRVDWLAAPDVTLTADLPLEAHEPTDPAISGASCLLLVEPARDQRVGQRPIGHETVRSLYESGTRSERNPDYDAAQLRLRQAERTSDEKTPGILRVGDPLLDLMGLLVGGVISGFSQGSHERDVDEAMSALAATPRSVEQPVYRPYQFERQTILAGKEATIPVALIDRANRLVWRTQLHQRERRQFDILDGLDPRDRDFEKYSSTSVSRQDFEHWQNEPPQLGLSVVVAALREAPVAPGPDNVSAAIDQLEAPLRSAAAPSAPVGPSPGPPPEPASDRTASHRPAWPAGASDPPADLEDRSTPPAPAEGVVAEATATGELLAEAGGGRSPAPGAGPAVMPGADPRIASIVRVDAGARAGSAVYVRSDLVLTTAELVAGSVVVGVATADRTRVLGLVARADQARNLALVQVARPGPPVAVYDGPPVAVGGPIEGIALAEQAGVVVTPGRYRGPAATPRVTGSASAERVQVEVQAPPVQPEALPWFLGDRVIALGTGGPVGSGRSLLSAIQASDIRAFLYGATGALAELR